MGAFVRNSRKIIKYFNILCEQKQVFWSQSYGT
jgi:hypothetical protein